MKHATRTSKAVWLRSTLELTGSGSGLGLSLLRAKKANVLIADSSRTLQTRGGHV